MEKILGRQWIDADQLDSFWAFDPKTGERIGEEYPISDVSDVMNAAAVASSVFREIHRLPGSVFGRFLTAYATGIEAMSAELYQAASLETGLPLARFQNAEGLRTLNQLRMAAAAAESGEWRNVVSDGEIRSEYAPIGPQLCIGPNNFPLAFNGIAGGEFAAAVATGCPVVALGHRGHPRTTKLLASAAEAARHEAGLPEGFVQLLYGVNERTWGWLISNKSFKKVNFTGSRRAGMDVLRICAAAGRPASVEMGSLNAVFVMDSALADPAATAKTIGDSVLLGSGQFCTRPGLIVLQKGARADEFISVLVAQFRSADIGPLLTLHTCRKLEEDIKDRLQFTRLVSGGARVDKPGFWFQPTLLQATGTEFLADSEEHQKDLFGPVAEIVVTDDFSQMLEIAQALQGSLSGGIFTAGPDQDSLALYDELTLTMGRPLVNRVPTGVTLSPAMVHGGPFPATGDPSATSVGIPRSLRGRLICFDNVPEAFRG